MRAAAAALAAFLTACHAAPAPAAAGPRDLGFMRLALPVGVRAEVGFRDALGGRLRGPSKAAYVRVGFERGTVRCGTATSCGDARATASVRWAPSLPFLFAIEAGPGLPPVPRPWPGRGRADFVRSPRHPGAWVSVPAVLPLAAGRRATARCTPSGACVVTVPLAWNARGWFGYRETWGDSPRSRLSVAAARPG